jgi:hypothetical protein
MCLGPHPRISCWGMWRAFGFRVSSISSSFLPDVAFDSRLTSLFDCSLRGSRPSGIELEAVSSLSASAQSAILGKYLSFLSGPGLCEIIRPMTATNI